MPTPSAAAAWSPAPAISVDSCAGGSHSSGISSASQTSSDQRRPGDVEEERSRRVGRVDRALAGQPEAGRSPSAAGCGGSRVRLGLVPSQPQELRRREARSARGCRSARSAARARPAPRSPRTRRAVRWSFQRIAGRRTRSSASSTTSPCICPESPIGPSGSRARHACAARHQSSGSCSAQPGCGVESGYGSSALGQHAPSCVDRDALDAGRADVEADEGLCHAPSAA